MATTIVAPDGSRITLDAEVRFDVVLENAVTVNRVEDASFVNDHIERRPEVVTLSGPVSDRAFGSDKSFAEDDQRARRARDFFRSISGQVVKLVTTSMGTYPSMALLRAPHSRTTRRGVVFTLSFIEVRTGTRSAILTPLAPTQDVGKQTTTNPADPAEAENASALYRLGRKVSLF